jgi:RNA polymerase sigma factor (sigma-70 family)
MRASHAEKTVVVIGDQSGAVMRHLRTLFSLGTIGGMSDGHLLDLFATQRDEAAFAALVERHGGMVHRVCRRVLGEPDDVQDVSQVVFLVLALRARSIRRGSSVASWLHGVALRTAGKARLAAARRRAHERRGGEMRARSASELAREEAEPWLELHEELDRLPARFREPIVLCYLEGLSREMAAQQLGWPLGTVQSRLARGRERLRDRLARRGVVFSAGLLGGISYGTSAEAMAAASAEAIVRAAILIANGESVAAAATGPLATITREATRALFLTKLQTTAGPAVLACGLVAMGIVTLISQRPAPGAATLPAEERLSTAQSKRLVADIGRAPLVVAASMENRLAIATGKAGGRETGSTTKAQHAEFDADESRAKHATTITGRVVDDQGRPISSALVCMPVRFDDKPDTTPHATSDAQGNYVLRVPDTWGRSPIHERRWIVWVHARGHRIGTANAWYALSGKPGSVDVKLGLLTDTSFTVLGPDGRPLAGAVVEPYLVFAPNNCYENPPAAMKHLISSVADAKGRAMLPTIAREALMSVNVTAASLGSQTIGVLALNLGNSPMTPIERQRDPQTAKQEIRLRAAGRIEGRLAAAQPEWTRKVKIHLATNDPTDTSRHAADPDQGLAEVITDDDGRFVVPAIAEGKLSVSPWLDPSLPVRTRPISDVMVRRDQTTKFVVFLQKAVRLRGSIRVKGSGEPVAGASIVVGYGADDADPNGKGRLAGSTTVVSDKMGRFETFGLPGWASLQVIALPDVFSMQNDMAIAGRKRVPDDAVSVELPVIDVVKASAGK